MFHLHGSTKESGRAGAGNSPGAWLAVDLPPLSRHYLPPSLPILAKLLRLLLRQRACITVWRCQVGVPYVRLTRLHYSGFPRLPCIVFLGGMHARLSRVLWVIGERRDALGR